MGSKTILFTVLVLLAACGFALAQQNVTRTQAEDSVANAEKDMGEMMKSGFGTAFVNDTLLEAKLALGKSDYASAFKNAELVSQRKSQAYNISDSLRALELGMDELESAGLNSTGAREIFNKSVGAFASERYEETEKLISQAYAELADVRAEATLVNIMINSAKENVVSFIKENVSNILVSVVVLFMAGYACFEKLNGARIKNKIRDLEIEKTVLKDLMKKAQSDHFEKRTMTRETYEIRMRKYKERIAEIRETLPVLKARAGSKKMPKARRPKI